MKVDPRGRIYYLVTDIWFDPVKGQRRRGSGEMVAVRAIDQAGQERGSKWAHTITGLAAQGYQPADVDFIALARARADGVATGQVVGIGFGRALRMRPKIAGL